MNMLVLVPGFREDQRSAEKGHSREGRGRGGRPCEEEDGAGGEGALGEDGTRCLQ